jgi:hypothetical protein
VSPTQLESNRPPAAGAVGSTGGGAFGCASSGSSNRLLPAAISARGAAAASIRTRST